MLAKQKIFEAGFAVIFQITVQACANRNFCEIFIQFPGRIAELNSWHFFLNALKSDVSGRLIISSLKRFEQIYGLYVYEDQSGYLRLTIEKKKQNLTAYYSFNSLSEGWQILRKLVSQFELCPKLCFIQKGNEACTGLIDNSCHGACIQTESADNYNKRLRAALQSLQEMLPSFIIRDRGRNSSEESFVLIENGRFYGMGWLDKELQIQNLDSLKEQLTVYPENDYMRGLVYSYAEKWPDKKVWEYGSMGVLE